MATPNESGMDGMGWAVLVGTLGIIVAFLKKLDPRLVLVWLNAPVMAPIHAKLDTQGRELQRVRLVIDKLPGAKEAHEAVKADKARWEL